MSVTSSAARGRFNVSRPLLLAALAVALAGAAVGVWIDWTWWSPVYGVQVIAILVMVVAVPVAFLLRHRLPGILPVALAAAVGLAAGMWLGPSREATAHVTGTMTVRIDRPAGGRESTLDADCTVVPSGDHVSVTGGEVGDAMTLPDGRGLSLWVTVGDMWSRGPWARPDHIAVHAIVTPGRGTPIPDDGFPTEIRVTSTPRSQVSATVNGSSGSITFAGLESYEDGKPEVTTPFDLAGTVAWTCDEATDRAAFGS